MTVGKTVRKLVTLRSLAYNVLKVKLLILKLEINALPYFETLGSNHDEELRLRRREFQPLFMDCYTLRKKALRSFETWGNTQNHGVTSKETYFNRSTGARTSERLSHFHHGFCYSSPRHYIFVGQTDRLTRQHFFHIRSLKILFEKYIYCYIWNNSITTDLIVHPETSLSRRGNTMKKHSLNSRRILFFFHEERKWQYLKVFCKTRTSSKSEGAHCCLLVIN